MLEETTPLARQRPPAPPAGTATIFPEEAHRLQQAGEALIVDVREASERVGARIPGSIHVPLGQIPQRAAELPTDRTLVLQCASGNRSESATQYLLADGHPDARNLTGGILAWYHAGLPIVQGAEDP